MNKTPVYSDRKVNFYFIPFVTLERFDLMQIETAAKINLLMPELVCLLQLLHVQFVFNIRCFIYCLQLR